MRMRVENLTPVQSVKLAKILRKPYKAAVENLQALWYDKHVASQVGRTAELGAPRQTIGWMQSERPFHAKMTERSIICNP